LTTKTKKKIIYSSVGLGANLFIGICDL